MQSQYYKTEKMLFKYFAYIKAYKYFSVPYKLINHNPDITHADIANALYNAGLNNNELETICEYGMRQHAPKRRGTNSYSAWLNGVCLLNIEFQKRGWVAC